MNIRERWRWEGAATHDYWYGSDMVFDASERMLVLSHPDSIQYVQPLDDSAIQRIITQSLATFPAHLFTVIITYIGCQPYFRSVARHTVPAALRPLRLFLSPNTSGATPDRPHLIVAPTDKDDGTHQIHGWVDVGVCSSSPTQWSAPLRSVPRSFSKLDRAYVDSYGNYWLLSSLSDLFCFPPRADKEAWKISIYGARQIMFDDGAPTIAYCLTGNDIYVLETQNNGHTLVSQRKLGACLERAMAAAIASPYYCIYVVDSSNLWELRLCSISRILLEKNALAMWEFDIIGPHVARPLAIDISGGCLYVWFCEHSTIVRIQLFLNNVLQKELQPTKYQRI